MAARRPLVDVGGRVKQLPAGDRLDLPLATTTDPGLMAAADKAKLNSVQNGATANSTDAALLNRANHTGTQPASTITGLGSAAYAVAQTGVVDQTAGRLLINGAYGIGTTVSPTPASIDSIPYTGFFLGSAANGSPNGDTGSTGINLMEGINYGWQLIGKDGGTPGLMHRTHSGPGVWGAWVNVWDSYNFNPANYSTTAQMQAEIAAAKPAPVLEVAVSTTLNLSHANRFLWSTTSGALTITVPANSSVAFPVGAEIHLGAFTAGSLTLTAAGGVTLDLPNGGSAVLGPNMNATLKKMQTNRWRLIGQTVAA